MKSGLYTTKIKLVFLYGAVDLRVQLPDLFQVRRKLSYVGYHVTKFWWSRTRNFFRRHHRFNVVYFLKISVITRTHLTLSIKEPIFDLNLPVGLKSLEGR